LKSKIQILIITFLPKTHVISGQETSLLWVLANFNRFTLTVDGRQWVFLVTDS